MKQFISLLLPGLLGSQLANAQPAEPKGKLVVNEKLVSRFIKQGHLLRQAAIAQHLKKKTSPVPDWLIPAPGDKLVTYYRPGDTLLFYQSGNTATLHWCRLANAASFAQTVPFLAGSKATLFAGKYPTYRVIRVTDSSVSGVYTLLLTFQGSHIRRVVFDTDTSTF